MSHTPTKVGIIGCGRISETYVPNAKRFRAFDIVTIADTRTVKTCKTRFIPCNFVVIRRSGEYINVTIAIQINSEYTI